MITLDKHPHIIQWGSEEIVIPYKSPIDGRWHRYFTDFVVKRINKNNNKTETIIIEVKPSAQCSPPKKQQRVTQRYLNEVKTWGVNEAKWKAADEFCKDRGWKFQIFTEKDLGV